MKKQRIVSILLTFCLILSIVPAAFAVDVENFTDVSETDWFYDYVDYVTDKEYFVGTTRTTFSPNANMTRAMFVVVLARFDNVKVDNSQSAFTDVKPGAWCAGAINWAAENRIVTGYGNGKFEPNASITRAQMCAIMDRYVDYYTAKHKVTVAKNGSGADLADQDQIPAYAKTSVKNCQLYGLIAGYGDGTFRPYATSTRAHVAAVIYRLHFLIANAKPSSSGGGSSSPSYPTTTYSTYTLTYNANGGTFSNGSETYADSLQNASSTKSFTIISGSSEPTRDGYKLLGWADSSSATSASYTAGGTIDLTASKTIYAVWEAAAPKITYDLNYEDAPDLAAVAAVEADGKWSFTVWQESDITGSLPAGSTLREGYVLLNWNTAADGSGTGYEPGSQQEATKDLTLYAQWIKADDLIGRAVKAAMTEAQSRYDTLAGELSTAVQTAFKGNSYITSDRLNKIDSAVRGVVDFGNIQYKNTIKTVDNVLTRPQTLTASVGFGEDTVSTIIAKSTILAMELVDAKDPSSGVSSIVDCVIDAVEAELGVDLLKTDTNEQLKQKVQDAVEKMLTDEGKGLWDNFYDNEGHYYCGDVTIVAGEGESQYTVKVNVDAKARTTTLDGGVTKTEAVKKIAEALSKEMFQDLKDLSAAAKNGYVSKGTVSGTATLTFAPSDYKTYADKTSTFPYVYPVTLELALDSNQVVEYKLGSDKTNYVKINITKAVQQQWNETVEELIAALTSDPGTKGKVADAIWQELAGKESDYSDGMAAKICNQIGEQLKPYGITLTNTSAKALVNALCPTEQDVEVLSSNAPVVKWIDYVSADKSINNWSVILDAVGSGKIDTSKMDMSDLVDAMMTVLEQDIPEGNALDTMLAGVIQTELDKIAKDRGENWIATEFNNNNLVKAAKTMLNDNAAYSLNPNVSLEVTSVADINALINAGQISVLMGDVQLMTLEAKVAVYATAGDMLAKKIQSNELLKQLLTDGRLSDADQTKVKDYLIYSALCEAGLAFKTEKAASINQTVDVKLGKDSDGNDVIKKRALLDYLRSRIVDICEDKVDGKVRTALGEVNIKKYLEEYAGYVTLMNRANKLYFPEATDETLAGMAELLKDGTLQEQIGSTGDGVVEKYLSRAIGMLPAGASITIKGVTIDEAMLTEAFKDAKTTAQAMNALAGILSTNGISNLSIKSFADNETETGGIPVTVQYNSRTFEFNLVIEVK